MVRKETKSPSCMPICLPFFNQRRKFFPKAPSRLSLYLQRARTAPPGITSSSKSCQKAENPRPECMRAQSPSHAHCVQLLANSEDCSPPGFSLSMGLCKEYLNGICRLSSRGSPLTQGSELHLLHCMQKFFTVEPLGKRPRPEYCLKTLSCSPPPGSPLYPSCILTLSSSWCLPPPEMTP